MMLQENAAVQDRHLEKAILKYINIPYFNNNPWYLSLWRRYYSQNKDPAVLFLMRIKGIGILSSWIYTELHKYYKEVNQCEICAYTIIRQGLRIKAHPIEELAKYNIKRPIGMHCLEVPERIRVFNKEWIQKTIYIIDRNRLSTETRVLSVIEYNIVQYLKIRQRKIDEETEKGLNEVSLLFGNKKEWNKSIQTEEKDKLTQPISKEDKQETTVLTSTRYTTEYITRVPAVTKNNIKIASEYNGNREEESISKEETMQAQEKERVKGIYSIDFLDAPLDTNGSFLSPILCPTDSKSKIQNVSDQKEEKEEEEKEEEKEEIWLKTKRRKYQEEEEESILESKADSQKDQTPITKSPSRMTPSIIRDVKDSEDTEETEETEETDDSIEVLDRYTIEEAKSIEDILQTDTLLTKSTENIPNTSSTVIDTYTSTQLRSSDQKQDTSSMYLEEKEIQEDTLLGTEIEKVSNSINDIIQSTTNTFNCIQGHQSNSITKDSAQNIKQSTKSIFGIPEINTRIVLQNQVYVVKKRLGPKTLLVTRITNLENGNITLNANDYTLRIVTNTEEYQRYQRLKHLETQIVPIDRTEEYSDVTVILQPFCEMGTLSNAIERIIRTTNSLPLVLAVHYVTELLRLHLDLEQNNYSLEGYTMDEILISVEEARIGIKIYKYKENSLSNTSKVPGIIYDVIEKVSKENQIPLLFSKLPARQWLVKLQKYLSSPAESHALNGLFITQEVCIYED
ncbi:hypothetical protein NEOKW01_1225 [Nematocida sp. AWRm80]|nr:hypothetical protein NEOKW01_1225 [Nematocida sp. AWRm80]